MADDNGNTNETGAASAAPARREILERHGRWYGMQHFAVAFTAGIVGDHAKRVLTKGWPLTKPLADAEYGAGLLATRGESRNPVVVLRASGLVGIEADSAEDIARVEAIGLPATATVRSSSDEKRHWYFRAPAKLRANDPIAFRFEQGNLTADSGRYFVCPPAIHPSGEVYRFLQAPDELELAEMPSGTYAWLCKKATQEQGEQRQALRADPDTKILEGQNRHGAVTAYARSVCNWTSNLEVLLASTRAWNQAHCDPPISDSELLRSCQNMLTKYAKGHTPALDGVRTDAAVREYIATVNGGAPLGNVDGAELLDQLVQHFRRYMIMSDAQTDVVALFSVLTYCVDAFTVVPYLRVSSPVKRTGKSRLLELLEFAVHKPVKTGGLSEAALFRSLASGAVTLLFDEVGKALGEKSRDRNSAVEGVLLNGFTAGTPVLRCVGEGTHQTVEPFDVFGPKVLAGTGQLDDMIGDRCLPISLQRKAPGENVERLRRRDASETAAPLRAKMAAWADAHVDELAHAHPDLPAVLDDRAQDISEPLLAIADLAAGHWPRRSRRAVVELRTSDTFVDEDLGTELLADARRGFDSADEADPDRLATEQVIFALCSDPERPWKTFNRGDPITPRQLADLLRPFQIRSRTIRFSDGTTCKGFLREQFADAWHRYLERSA